MFDEKFTHKCLRCNGTWETILRTPDRCGICGNRLWNQERVRKSGAGRPKGKPYVKGPEWTRGGRPKNPVATNRTGKISTERTDLDTDFQFES